MADRNTWYGIYRAFSKNGLKLPGSFNVSIEKTRRCLS